MATLNLPLGPSKPCRYGTYGWRCGRPSTTKRQRPSGGETWDVCDQHAGYLDRIKANVEKHKPLLDRLRDEGD